MRCQRWNHHRDAWRPAGEPFLPGRHEVAEIDETTAKRFVESHHYSASYPAARFRVGLFRAGSGRIGSRDLAGVAVFSVPMNNGTITKYTGLAPAAGVELGRFVLLDEVEGNGESWMLARAFELLRQERTELRAVIAYSDPLPRDTLDGHQVTPGHVGTIYQAHNGRYLGRGRAEPVILDPDGRTISRRALSKLRNDERGAGYVYERLRACGAPARLPLEDGAAYVRRAIESGPFRRVRHPGNHAYVWPIGNPAARRELVKQFAKAYPYPKRSDHAAAREP